MATAKQILDVARAELGVKESPAYSNNVKYNTEYYGYSVNSPAYAWCMVFVWWVFKHANASKLFYDGGKCAGCTTFMRWAKGTGRWVTSGYKPGDIILYDFDGDRSESEHVGICESASGSYVTVIEGNTGSTNDADGGQVQRRQRSTSLVIGAYRPAYDGAEATITTGTTTTNTTNTTGGKCNVELRIIQRGSTGADVKALQVLLKGYGYDPNGIDSIFGPGCQDAVKRYQKAKGLNVDGCVGPATWGSLLGK